MHLNEMNIQTENSYELNKVINLEAEKIGITFEISN